MKARWVEFMFVFSLHADFCGFGLFIELSGSSQSLDLTQRSCCLCFLRFIFLTLLLLLFKPVVSSQFLCLKHLNTDFTAASCRLPLEHQEISFTPLSLSLLDTFLSLRAEIINVHTLLCPHTHFLFFWSLISWFISWIKLEEKQEK